MTRSNGPYRATARSAATIAAKSLPFTVRTLADIEQGVRTASPGTYAMLENKLASVPGSIDTILAGGEPTDTVVELRRATSPPLSHASTDALSRTSTEELLLELRRRIVAPATDATKPGTTGAALTAGRLARTGRAAST